jgi:hypothetical protein
VPKCTESVHRVRQDISEAKMGTLGIHDLALSQRRQFNVRIVTRWN